MNKVNNPYYIFKLLRPTFVHCVANTFVSEDNINLPHFAMKLNIFSWVGFDVLHDLVHTFHLFPSQSSTTESGM
jgi:hypothetical protein